MPAISTSTALLIASLIASGLASGHAIGSTASKNDKANISHAEGLDILDHIGKSYPTIAQNPYWQSLTESEKIALLNDYVRGSSILGTDNINYDSLVKDLDEYYNLIGNEPLLEDYVDINAIEAEAEAAIAAENEALLNSLNEDLQSTGDAYVQSRDALLTQQHQNNAQVIDTLASDMARARRNAIEAGASAGVRIAENVNTLLSAQNKMSQQSLETSNQLAQMLVSQRNAEAGLRNQWRDAQMSTYDRVQGRIGSEMSLGQAKYNQAYSNWQTQNERNTSATNPLVDRMVRYKSNSSPKY